MSDINIFEAAYDAAEADCKALRAENERLREALEKIAAGDFTITDDGVRLPRRIAGPSAKIALAALEQPNLPENPFYEKPNE